MTISEETLMAFADGEVDQATRDAVERAMHDDPEVSQHIARHRALRRRLQAGFADELSDPVPERLLSLVRDTPAGSGNSNVVNLQQAQAARARAAQGRSAKPHASTDDARGSTFWRVAPSIAAGVVLGLVIGYSAWRQGALPIVRSAAGTLVANGSLDGALTNQLAGEAANGTFRVGMSFVAKSGEYCRSFTLASSPASGLACRHAGQWLIQALTQDGAERVAGYRPAATAWSPVILKMIQDEIQGEPLDATGESAARQHGWQSPK